MIDFGRHMMLKDGVSGSFIMSFMRDRVKLDT